MARGLITVELTRESLATIREVLEAELVKLEEDGECERHFIHCIAVIEALDELPKIK
jgi:hypothetical protein